MTEPDPQPYVKHEVPEDYLGKWQEAIDVLAGVFDVPAGLIMRVHPDEIEVLVSSRRPDNPYEPAEKAKLQTGLYCETVMETRAPLLVPNALADPAWKDNPDVKLDMISYIGMPLIWPDKSVFGTVCVLDKKELETKQSYLDLVEQFKQIIERDFQMMVRNSELQGLSRELEGARVAAETANTAKSSFLANMSHELRTPMNAILGYSEMLIEEAEEQELPGFVDDLKKVHQAGSHLLSLINGVLDLAKIESGRMEVFAEDFEVAALVEQVAGTVQPLVAKKDNQLKIECDEGLGLAHQDRTKLHQSLLNLLSNAAKFSEKDVISLRVEREPRAEGDWLVFTVTDRGLGIPADHLDKVFDEFTQVESGTTRNHGGTGLGLPISRKFCRMLGGELDVQSVVGEGSAFTMRVPARFSAPRKT